MKMWLVLAVFLSNTIACVLAAYCLARMTDPRRSRRHRTLLVILGSWALIGGGYYDMLFVAATNLQAAGVEVRYALATPILTVLVLSGLAAVALMLVSRRPTIAWILVGGAAVGLLVGVASLRAIDSVRSGQLAPIDFGNSIPTVASFSVVVAISVALAISAFHRALLAAAIMVLGTAMTATQYVLAGQTLVARASGDGATAARGLLPTAAILLAVLAFVARTTALLVVSLTDPTGSGQPRAPVIPPSRTARTPA